MKHVGSNGDANVEVHRCGHVAIVGRPNVGKSTLLNRLVGQKLAITSHKPQTTRHSIIGVNTLPNAQLIYVDTPGIHRRGEQPMNRYLNRTAKSVLAGVDVVVFVIEALAWTAEDQIVADALREIDVPLLAVVNKVDTVKDKNRLLPFLASLGERLSFQAIIPVSARHGQHVEEVERALLPLLPEGENIYPDDQLTDRSSRFLAAELVREQLTRLYDKELPYALTVEIEKFEEQGELLRIFALVSVEKASQKAILIGKGGAAMKEASRRARLAMEKLFGKKVFLRVWVKVNKSWSADEKALASLGYREDG